MDVQEQARGLLVQGLGFSGHVRLREASFMAQRVENVPEVQETRVQPLSGAGPWRKEWLPTLVFLSGEFHGQRSLVGYRSWGCKELDMTEEITHTQAPMG